MATDYARVAKAQERSVSCALNILGEQSPTTISGSDTKTTGANGSLVSVGNATWIKSAALTPGLYRVWLEGRDGSKSINLCNTSNNVALVSAFEADGRTFPGDSTELWLVPSERPYLQALSSSGTGLTVRYTLLAAIS